MKIIFGRKTCEQCRKELNTLDALQIPYQYHDLDTVEGLAQMAYLGIIVKEAELPIVIER